MFFEILGGSFLKKISIISLLFFQQFVPEVKAQKKKKKVESD